MRMLIVVCLLIAAGITMSAERADAGPFIRINKIDTADYPNVRVHLTATDGVTGHLSDLTEENLYVIEDGYRVNYVKMVDPESSKDLVYLVFAADSSRSIRKDNFKKLKKIAGDIARAGTDRERVALYRFNNEVVLLSNFSGSRTDLARLIDRIEQHGTKTLLYNAIYDSLDLLSRAEGSARAVIVFTDGKDEGSSVSSSDIIKFSRDLGIPVHFVCVDGGRYVQGLSRIAKLTGGSLYRAKQVGDVGDIHRSLVRALKSPYVLQYKSMLSPDSKKHALEVRLKHGHLRDRDIGEFSFSGRIFPFSIPTVLGAISLILLAVLVGVILYFAISHIRKRMPAHKRKTAGEPVTRKDMGDYHVAIDLDEQMRRDEDHVVTAADPEYVYAKAWLLEKDGPEVGKKFPIFWDEVTLGRGDDNAIVIKDDAVSLNHAKIKRVNNTYTLYDLVSDNGTYLNDNKLLRPKSLYDWDEIMIGRTVLLFRGSKSA